MMRCYTFEMFKRVFLCLLLASVFTQTMAFGSHWVSHFQSTEHLSATDATETHPDTAKAGINLEQCSVCTLAHAAICVLAAEPFSKSFVDQPPPLDGVALQIFQIPHRIDRPNWLV